MSESKYSVQLRVTEKRYETVVIEAKDLDEAQAKASEFETDGDCSSSQLGQGEYRYVEVINVEEI